jgi:hypothetical protein
MVVVRFKPDGIAETTDGVRLPLECQQVRGRGSGGQWQTAVAVQATRSTVDLDRAGRCWRAVLAGRCAPAPPPSALAATPARHWGTAAPTRMPIASSGPTNPTRTPPRAAPMRTHVPLQLLGLPAGERVKDSVINEAFDALAAAPLEEGYSADATAGRSELLEIAHRDLVNAKGRNVEHKEVTIPYDLIPGALAILAEVGERGGQMGWAGWCGGALGWAAAPCCAAPRAQPAPSPRPGSASTSAARQAHPPVRCTACTLQPPPPPLPHTPLPSTIPLL